MTRLRRHMIPLIVLIGILGAWAVIEFKEVRTSNAQAPKPAQTVPFDGKLALGHIQELCKIGTRISGSEGMKRQQELIKEHFEKLGAKVEFQRFTAQQSSRPKPVDLANIIISWHPDRDRRVIICTHYDTRPRADQEANARNWDRAFLSANDGTSGVAWLMELGRHIKQMPLSVGVDFVLFDGEEFVWDGPHGVDEYFLGSIHFADQYKRKPPKHRYIGAVLLDLFAGQNVRFPKERNSLDRAGGLVRDIWDIAAELKVTAFQNLDGDWVNDDHLALNRAGIPAVDIIDFSYPHWHKLTDLPDKCSAESMEQVARVLTVWLQRVR